VIPGREAKALTTPAQRGASSAIVRWFALADRAEDDDDTRLRKRVGVVAGYLTILAPLSLPLQTGGQPLSWVLAVGLSTFSIVNLWVLAHTGRFDRYVVALISAGAVFAPVATFFGGGITGSSTGLVWSFLVPAYAIMALGPGRATPWFLAYLAVVALMIVFDQSIRDAVGPRPYELLLLGQVQNTVVPLSIVFLLLRYTDVRRRAAEAQVEELLTNAIPSSIAKRLRRGERRIAEAYPSTTVVFADIVGFTPWAQRTPPHEVVDLLDGMFTTFDELVEQHGLEKIKTIGDAYMAVAGAPQARSDHAIVAIEFSRAVIVAVERIRERTGLEIQVRIGVASGPVVAGVIGARRLQFDLWGDTVNLASRMESSGVAGRIQVPESTRDLLGNHVSLERREVDVKGLGPLVTYLVASEPAMTQGQEGAGPAVQDRPGTPATG
jgi:adenylate cyclase